MHVIDAIPRYRHLYKRTEETKSAEISKSIRAIFGTAHVLDVALENPAEGEADTLEEQLSSRVTNGEGLNVFICPLCGKDFRAIELFSKHNEREHNDKIEQLEMFSYVAAKMQCEDQDS